MFKIKFCVYSIIFVLSINFIFLNALHIDVYAKETTYGSIVDSVARLDTSNGVILGQKADYYIIIPKEIRELVVVDRANIKENSAVLEKLDFYCVSYSQKYKPAFIMSLYVFDKSLWKDSNDLKIVVKSRDYVFAADIASDNGFTQSQDKAYYSYCKAYLGEADSINNILYLSKAQKNLFSNTVFINGSPLKEKVEKIDGAYYVPLRQVFENLDYDVDWDVKTSSVVISKRKFKDSFALKNGKYNGKNFKITTINNRTYISTSYFLKVLNKSIEIDEADNIYMLAN